MTLINTTITSISHPKRELNENNMIGNLNASTSIKSFKISNPRVRTMSIPSGEISPDNDILIDDISAIEIAGAGIDQTILKNAGIIKNKNTPTSCVVIRDMTIDLGNTPNKNALNIVNNSKYFKLINVRLVNSNNRFLFHWGGVDDLEVDGCEFYDAGLVAGIDNAAGGQKVDSDGQTIFKNNIFIKEHSLGSALLTTGQTGDLIIKENKFIDKSGIAYAGVSIESQTGNSKDISIEKNKFENCGINIGVGSNSNTVNKINIKNNEMSGLGRGGIAVKRANKVFIENNNLENSMYGIYIVDTNFAKVEGNTIENTDCFNTGSFKSDKAGIYLNKVQITTIDNNTVYDTSNTTPYAIRAVGSLSNPTEKLYIGRNNFIGPFTTRGIEIVREFAVIHCANKSIEGIPHNLPASSVFI